MSFSGRTNRRISRALKYLKKEKLSRRKNVFYTPVRYFVAPGSNYLYTLNSKAGCTAIIASLYELETGETLDGDEPVHLHGGVKKFKTSELPEDYPRFYRFTVVRNPLDRLISFYANKFLDVESIRTAGFEFRYYLGGIFEPFETFESLVNKICEIPDQYADRHFISQYVQLIERVKFEYDHIGRLEQLEKSYQQIFGNAPIGKPVQRNASAAKFSDQIPVTRPLLDKIYQRYKKDFEYFEYEEAFQVAWEKAG